MSWEERQEAHEHAQAIDTEHDRSSCWCCCFDCPDLEDLEGAAA